MKKKSLQDEIYVLKESLSANKTIADIANREDDATKEILEFDYEVFVEASYGVDVTNALS